MTNCRCCGQDIVGVTARQRAGDFEVAMAVLQQFYTHETEAEFGVNQQPEPTPEHVDQAWWVLVGSASTVQGRDE